MIWEKERRTNRTGKKKPERVVDRTIREKSSLLNKTAGKPKGKKKPEPNKTNQRIASSEAKQSLTSRFPAAGKRAKWGTIKAKKERGSKGNEAKRSRKGHNLVKLKDPELMPKRKKGEHHRERA